MKIVGITGGLCSGTTTVAKYIEEKGFPVIKKEEIFKFLKSSGNFPNIPNLYLELSRNLEERKKVRSLLLSYIKKKQSFFLLACREVLFVDFPFLYECSLEEYFSEVLVITCGPKTQEERAEKKYPETHPKDTKKLFYKKDIKEILSNQIPISEKRKKSTYTVDNNKAISITFYQVDIILNNYNKYSIFTILMILIGTLSILIPLLVKLELIQVEQTNERLRRLTERLKKRVKWE